MKRKVIFAPLARLELEEAAAWYEGQRPGLGDQFKADVNVTLQQILKTPEKFRPATAFTRKAVLKRFHKYSIYYSIEWDAINVASVFHGSRNPDALRRRLD